MRCRSRRTRSRPCRSSGTCSATSPPPTPTWCARRRRARVARRARSRARRLDAFVRALQDVQVPRGDITRRTTRHSSGHERRGRLVNRAAVAASQAAQLYDLARAPATEGAHRPARPRLDAGALCHAASGDRRRFHNATIGLARCSTGPLAGRSRRRRRSLRPIPARRPKPSWPRRGAPGTRSSNWANDRGMPAFALRSSCG